MRRTYALLAAATLSGACAPTAQESPAVTACLANVPALREAIVAGPASLAERFAAQGDLRYLEWHGIGALVPGVRDQDCVRKGNHFRWLTGTSDAVCSEEHRRLYEQSYKFAEAYNASMAVIRARAGLPVCNGEG
jgi:hypothetical protein